MVSAAPCIELRGIGVRVGDTPILRGLDLEVEAGEVIGLHGSNGSGKTTLLRVLATLLSPTEGSGRVLGYDLGSGDRYQARPRIGLIGHVPALYPRLTLEENTGFVAQVTGRDHERVAEVLDTVGLGRARKRRADHCSYGMQRRAEFARLLLTEPEIVLLDEAHAGLDPEATDLVTLIVKMVRARRGAAVVVSHDPGRVDPIVDRKYELSGGRVAPYEDAR